MSPGRSLPGQSARGTDENVWCVISGTCARRGAARSFAHPDLLRLHGESRMSHTEGCAWE